jgi:hypothetical protein
MLGGVGTAVEVDETLIGGVMLCDELVYITCVSGLL